MARYQVLSPDGLIIENKLTYSSEKEALEAFDKWKERFVIQGYYSSTTYGRIELNELHQYCQLIKK